MKKILIITILMIVGITSWNSFSSYFVSDIKELYGCYIYNAKAFTDKICINEDKTYNQIIHFNNEKELIYNNSKWTPHIVSSDRGQIAVATLEGFILRGIHGDIQKYVDLDGKILEKIDKGFRLENGYIGRIFFRRYDNKRNIEMIYNKLN